MKSELQYFADVAVFAKIFGIQKYIFFTYTCDKNIQCGDYVQIPFSRRILSGIVVSLHKKQPEERKYRAIRKVLQKNMLTKKQIQLARFFSEEYLTPPEKIFRSFLLPKKPKKPEKESLSHLPLRQLYLPKNYLEVETSFLDLFQKKRHSLLISPPSEERLQAIFFALREKTKPEKQHLILFPDKASLFFAESFIKKFLDPKTFVIFHGSLTPRKKFFALTSIKEKKEIRFILGTKSALFCPFRNLGFIILEEEQRSSHKQREITPRYDTKRVVRKLADIYSAQLLFTSTTISISSLFLAKKEKWLIQKIQTRFIPSLHVTYPRKILQKKYYTKNKKIPFGSVHISNDLKNTIQRTLEKKRNFFLLVSRRGMGALNVCNQCKNILSCPKCDHALIARSNGTYYCGHCSYTLDIFAHCPSCHEMEFTRKIEGTQTVEKLIKQQFPHASIMRIDSDIKNLERTDDFFSKNDIIIGTPTAIYRYFGKRIGGSGVIDTDSFWKWPDYLAEENAFHLFSHLAEKSLTFTLQTYQPHHRVIKALLSQEGKDSFETELLEERRVLQYPPFAKRITLLGKHNDTTLLLKQSDFIRKIFSKYSSDILNLGESFIPIQKKDLHFQHLALVLKIFTIWTNPLEKEIIKDLQSLPINWVSDIDSEGIV
ncbi:MAG: hypothetical protein IPN70_03360 [Candidatus Moraniibacteriota bacterium]|nr:MAG: hypothetical protein IPN70_03360 [Candidatus Moranbacteria bacterium]